MYNKHVADLSKFAKQECPDGEINFVPWSKIEQAGAVSDDILYVANHFEFIAVGIYSGDLDEGILKGFIRGTICHTVILAADLIAKWRKELDDNGNFNPNPTSLVFEHLLRLFKQWATDDEKARLRHY